MKQLGISIATTAVKVIVLIFVIRYVVGLTSDAYGFGYRIFTEEPVSSSPGISYTISITEETTPKQLSQALEDYGLIRDKDLFYVQYLLSVYKDKLQPGNYELTTAMTAEEMLAVMAASDDEEE